MGNFEMDLAMPMARADGDDMAMMDFAETAGEVGGQAAPTASAPPVIDADGTFSDTNVQEAGVDEPDVVKTDGERLVTAVDGTLRVIDLTTPVPVEVAAVALDGDWGHSLFLDGDRVVVLASRQVPLDGPANAADDGRSMDPGWGPPGTQVSVYDLSGLGDPEGAGAPELVNASVLDGDLAAARRIGGQVRIVTTASPQPVSFAYPDDRTTESEAQRANRAALEATVATDWLPAVRPVTADGSIGDAEPLVACDAIGVPVEFAGFGSVVVSTLHTDDAVLDADASVGVMASDATVYASSGNLYVATSEWTDADMVDGTSRAGSSATGIHRFQLTGGGPAAYVASGQVEGRLLNQFAMSEHDGHLRVATTTDGFGGAIGMPMPMIDEPLIFEDELFEDEVFDDELFDDDVIVDVEPMPVEPGRPGDPGAPVEMELSDNVLHVLATDGADLVPVGQVSGMGLGERIYSVRYLGDMAYIVTFRETDPLYTLDLSDPTDPRVLGELKIPGFSTYLHPTDPGRLVGIGQEATETGQVVGLQVSLFDVSDPTDPRRTQQWILPDASSTAEYQHLAFLWWGPEQTLAVPVSEWQTGFEGLVVLEVSDAGITERGRIQHLPGQEVPTPCDVAGCPGVDPEPTSTTTAPDETTTTAPDATTTTEPAPTTAPPTTGDQPTTTEPDPPPVGPTTTPTTDPADLPQEATDTGSSGAARPDRAEVPIGAEPFELSEPDQPGLAPPSQRWPASARIERSIVVGDALITVSDAGVKVSGLADLQTRAWIPFG
jgi:hypothetical protein